MIRNLSAVALLICAWPLPAAAQDDEEFEFEFGDETEDADASAEPDEAPVDDVRPEGSSTAPARSPRPPDKPPEAPAPPPVISAPKAVPLGAGEQVEVQVQFEHTPAAPVLTSSVGRMTPLQPLGDNKFVAKLVLPDETDQVFAVLSSWDDHQPGPPGLQKVRLKQPAGVKLSKGLRVAVVAVPSRLRVDWKRPAEVYLLLHDRKGKAKDSAVALQADRGTVTLPERRAKGLFVAQYTPPVMIGTAFDSLSASPEAGVPGWAEVVIDGVTPKTQEITVSPERIRADGRSEATVRITLADADGTPLAGHSVVFEAIEGLIGDAQDKGQGVYEAKFTAPDTLPPEGKAPLIAVIGEAIPGEEPLRKEFEVALKAGPAAKAQIYSEPRRVPADGATAVKLYITVVDEAGNPAEGTPSVELDSGGVLGEPQAQSAGNWLIPWTPPLLPELEFTQRVQITLKIAGKRLPTKGQIRLEPRVKPELPGSRPLPHSYWSAAVGFTTLFGGGFAGATNGLSVEAGWLARVGETPFYAGFVPGVTILSGSASARDDTHMDPEFTESVRAEVTQAFIPLMGALMFQLQPMTAFDVYGGLGVGALLAYTRADSDVAFRGAANSVSLLGAISAPIGVEVPIGDGALTAEVQYFRSVGDLAGAGEDEGIGVVGTVQGVSLSAGWRWGQW